MIMPTSSQVPSFLLLLLVIFSLSLQQMQALESAEGRALLQWKETLSNTDGVLDSWSLSNFKNICNWTGALPGYDLENFEGMQDESATGDDIYLSQDDYIDFVLKRTERPVQRYNLFTFLDFSNNHFHGEIPQSIGKLRYIRFLNLSHNQLIGNIPSWLGNLSDLEALDLSSNQLVGKIPEQLATLTFLAVLNLSYNHLVGPIPHGPQFNTFNNDSYLGNTALFGFPLTIQCQGSNNRSQPQTPAPNGEEDSGNFGGGFGWRSVVIGYCSCMPFGIFVGYVVFLYGRPRWFVRFVLAGR